MTQATNWEPPFQRVQLRRAGHSPLSREVLTAFVAFASASLAVSEALKFRSMSSNEQPVELLAELTAAHDRLRGIFAEGDDDEAVCCHALTVLVLADRLSECCL